MMERVRLSREFNKQFDISTGWGLNRLIEKWNLVTSAILMT